MLQVQISSFIQKVCPHNNRAWGLVIISKVLNLTTRWHWRSPSNLAVFWSCLIFIQKTFLVVPLLIESSKPFVLVWFPPLQRDPAGSARQLRPGDQQLLLRAGQRRVQVHDEAGRHRPAAAHQQGAAATRANCTQKWVSFLQLNEID